MKIIQVARPTYIDWWVVCNNCRTISELTEEGDLVVHESGDYTSEGTLKFICPKCESPNYGSYSRFKAQSIELKRKGVELATSRN